MRKYPYYIDLFSGCGGLALGLHRAGWRGLFAIEKDPMAFKTLQHNLIEKSPHFVWPKWLPERHFSIATVLRSYREELAALKGKVSLIAGGPPCQGFSINGKREPDDHRNKLVNSYIQIVRLVQPKLLFFENVRGFTMEFIKAGSPHVFSNAVTRRLENLGYNIQSAIIDFSEYCVPQRRLRYILVGVKDGDPKQFFEFIRMNCDEFRKERHLKRQYSVSQAIADLEMAHGAIPSPETRGFNCGIYGPRRNQFQVLMRNGTKTPDSHRFVNHQSGTTQTFAKILKSATRNRHLSTEIRKQLRIKKRSITPLSADKPSPTLTSLPDDLIHYSEPRVLTVREYARIQTFDDSFHFKGEYTSGGNRRSYQVPRYTQIGNAIPPLFAEQAGLALMPLLKE